MGVGATASRELCGSVVDDLRLAGHDLALDRRTRGPPLGSVARGSRALQPIAGSGFFNGLLNYLIPCLGVSPCASHEIERIAYDTIAILSVAQLKPLNKRRGLIVGKPSVIPPIPVAQ